MSWWINRGNIGAISLFSVRQQVIFRIYEEIWYFKSRLQYENITELLEMCLAGAAAVKHQCKKILKIHTKFTLVFIFQQRGCQWLSLLLNCWRIALKVANRSSRFSWRLPLCSIEQPVQHGKQNISILTMVYCNRKSRSAKVITGHNMVGTKCCRINPADTQRRFQLFLTVYLYLNTLSP